MDIRDCIYPDCQIKTEFGRGCEHSCEWQEKMKRPKPNWHDCLAHPLDATSRTSGDTMSNDEEFQLGMIMHEIASATDVLWNMTVGHKCNLDRLGLPNLEKAWATLGAIIEHAHQKDAA